MQSGGNNGTTNFFWAQLNMTLFFSLMNLFSASDGWFFEIANWFGSFGIIFDWIFFSATMGNEKWRSLYLDERHIVGSHRGKNKKQFVWFFFKKNTFVFFFVGSPKNSLAASLPYERKKAKHGRKLMESSDANKLPQKNETNSNPEHVLVFKKIFIFLARNRTIFTEQTEFFWFSSSREELMLVKKHG